ncbi:MAG: hypothetical protein NVS3B20_06550 [Polyangiales bacterium]
MAAPSHHVQYTFTEYLALEASSNVKHEYLEGQIYAMAGGTPEHAALAATVVGLLFPQLREGRCRAYDSDLRVRVRDTGLATYPDVTVVCGARERDPDDAQAVINPTLIIEVLSRSTERYDRGEKFEHYQRIATLREYVLVSQPEHKVEVFSRGLANSWSARVFVDGDVAELPAIGAQLDVRELYQAAAEPTD